MSSVKVVSGEELCVNAIELIEVASIFEPDGCLHDVVERATREREYVRDVLQCLARVSFYPASDDAAVFVSGDLAAHEHKSASSRRH